MRILGIDPGPVDSGYFYLDTEKECRYFGPSQYSGYPEVKGIIPNPDLMSIITEHFDQIDIIGMEMIASYGMPVGMTTHTTNVWIGRFLQMADILDIPTVEETRKQICIHICNDGRAKDPNIRQALIDRYGKPGKKMDPNWFYDDGMGQRKMSKDMWSALAVATFVADLKELDNPKAC